jgi:hypothetical protein
MTIDRRTLKRVALPIPIRITIESDHIAGTTRDISKRGLCLELPTPRLKTSPVDLLNERVTLCLENETIIGSIKWYTVEGSIYQIGISIDRKSTAAWKRIVELYMREHLANAVKPA